MSAQVLLSLLNEFPSFLSLFRNEFNKLNNTGAQMLDSIYHMILYYFEIIFFGVKTLGFRHLRDVKSVIL